MAPTTAQEPPFFSTPDPTGPEQQGNRKNLSSQAAEDWLFAYANAQSHTARATMWPHLVESVETLIAESRYRHIQHAGNRPSEASANACPR